MYTADAKQYNLRILGFTKAKPNEKKTLKVEKVVYSNHINPFTATSCNLYNNQGRNLY